MFFCVTVGADQNALACFGNEADKAAGARRSASDTEGLVIIDVMEMQGGDTFVIAAASTTTSEHLDEPLLVAPTCRRDVKSVLTFGRTEPCR